MTANTIQLVILLCINALSVFLIIIVSGNSLKSRLNLWFVLMTITLMGWVNFSYLGFTAKEISLGVLFYRLNWFFVSLFFYAIYVFYLENFLKIQKPLLKAGLLVICVAFAGISLFSNLIIQSVSSRDWGNEITFGDVNIAFNAFSVLFSILFITFFATHYKGLPEDKKKGTQYFLVGAVLLIIFNVVFNIVIPMFLNTAKYQTFGDFSSVLFFALTSFAILRKSFMGVKVALTAFLISVIGMFLIVDILFMSDTSIEQIGKVIILSLFVGISVLLVRSVVNEIKQREQLELVNKALDKSRQKYFDLASEQKDIIDVMGHEIRTPLTAIVQELNLHKALLVPKKNDWLENKIVDPERTKMLNLIFESIDTIDKASAHAVDLVNDMLETARLDKKRFSLDYSTFSIAPEVETSVMIMSKTVNKNECEITFENNLQGDLQVDADKTRVKEAIVALLSNAIKYHDPKKPVCIVKVVLSQTATTFRIDIIDNGIGIAKDDIHKLGKKFLRLNPKSDDSNIKRPGGTGLGLFVVKGIMDYHKGKMLIDSAGVGKGSTFSIEFPIKKS